MNQRATRAPEHLSENPEALGVVARHVIDHGSMMLRDGLKIARLEARRYMTRALKPAARRYGIMSVAGACAMLALVCGLVALFLGIASAIGSVAWTFAIFCGLFVLTSVVMLPFAYQQPTTDEVAEAERMFPREHIKESLTAEHLRLQEAGRELREQEARRAHQRIDEMARAAHQDIDQQVERARLLTQAKQVEREHPPEEPKVGRIEVHDERGRVVERRPVEVEGRGRTIERPTTPGAHP